MHNTGSTDQITSSSGSAYVYGKNNVEFDENEGDASKSLQNTFLYRGEEDPWGEKWEWIDGCNIKDGQIWICSNPEDYEDDKFEEPYKKLSYTIANKSGYIKEMGYDKTSSSTYYCDRYICDEGGPTIMVGSRWGYDISGGLYRYNVVTSDFTANTIVPRLSYKPS